MVDELNIVCDTDNELIIAKSISAEFISSNRTQNMLC